MRKTARESVFKVLFAYLFTNNLDSNTTNIIYNEDKLNEKDIEFANDLLSKIIEKKDFLIEEISPYLTGYKSDRLYKTDKCAILIAICEMNYFEDVPFVVSIDEAVNLAKKYSTENSLSFINGVLAEYKKNLELKGVTKEK